MSSSPPRLSSWTREAETADLHSLASESALFTRSLPAVLTNSRDV